MTRPVIIGAYRPADRIIQRISSVIPEFKPGAVPGGFVIIFDRIIEAAGGAHDGQRTVPQRIHLIQSAGFVQRGHDEKIGPRFDAMGHSLMKTDIRADLPRVALRQAPEILLISRIAAAQQ